MQQHGYPPTARAERKGEFIGPGCFVQGIGLVLPFVGFWFAFIPGALVGGLVGVLLLLVGGRMALKWVCGACKNPIASGAVRMCPTCRATLG